VILICCLMYRIWIFYGWFHNQSLD